MYSLRNDSKFAKTIIDNIGESGQIKRKIYQRRLPENPSLDYYYILRETGDNTEPVLIEYGFIDNKNDQYKLNNYIENYAEAVVKSISEYLNINYTFDENEYDYYIVKSGDTLYKIANLNNMTISELKTINNLDKNIIYVGQKLKVKNNNLGSNEIIYVVKPGDSLWSISRNYNVPVNEIIKINNLKDSTIYVNDKLIIPNKSMKKYIVKNGDTLWSISRKNGISVQELKEKNNLKNNILKIGQELII